MNPELAALLAVIRGEPDHTGRVWSPDEDAPRLVCADWLEEHGDEPERGEFIRVQCELAKIPWDDADDVPSGYAREWHELRRRERELWDAQTRNWPPNQVGRCIYRRGFLAVVQCPWDAWSLHGDSILADPWVPGLDEVELTTWPSREEWESAYVFPGSPEVSMDLLSRMWEQVRSWKLPPERERIDLGNGTVYRNVGTYDEPLWERIGGPIVTDRAVFEGSAEVAVPIFEGTAEISELCDCPRCVPDLYNGCVRCGRLERFDRPHNCRPRMFVEDEWPCRAVRTPAAGDPTR